MVSGTQKIDLQETLRVLPPDIRYYNRFGPETGIILTLKPCLRTLKVQQADGKIKKVKYEFPHLCLVWTKRKGLDMMYAYEEIVEKTMLYKPQLPNFGKGTRACLGNISVPDIEKCELSKFREAMWKIIFDGIYTSHSNAEMYKRMCTEKIISDFKDVLPKSEAVGSFKTVANDLITGGKFNLFR
jgi:hypothetical protein